MAIRKPRTSVGAKALVVLGLSLALACGGLPGDLAAEPGAPSPAGSEASLPVAAGQIFFFDRDTQPDVAFDMDLAVRFSEDGTVAVAEIEGTHHGRFERVPDTEPPALRVTGWERVQGIDGLIEPYIAPDLTFEVIDGGRALRLTDGRRFVAVDAAPIAFREPG